MNLKTRTFFNKYKLTFIGVIVGAIGGYLYYRLVGCESGACAITSSPINSTLYGMLLGGLLFNMFQKEKKESDKTQSTDNKQVYKDIIKPLKLK
jgi:LytS/YehU family sensor histidine kinase